jgi:hypothetical protein
MIQRQLDKDEIESLVASVFEASLKGQEVFFKVGEKYRFGVEFVVQDEYLVLGKNAVSRIKND